MSEPEHDYLSLNQAFHYFFYSSLPGGKKKKPLKNARVITEMAAILTLSPLNWGDWWGALGNVQVTAS